MPDRVHANENPWYVLATIHGEQDGDRIDWALHAKNRTTWNRFMAVALDEEARDALKARFDPDDLMPLSEPKRADLERNMARRGQSLPDPLESASFSGIEVPHRLVLGHFLFPNDANFREAAFQGTAFFSEAAFQGDADFSEAAFQAYAGFNETAFQGDAYFAGAAKGGAGGDGRARALTGHLDPATDVPESRLSATLSAPEGVPTSAHREFAGFTEFEKASFAGRAVFTNRVFLAETDFNGATFRAHPPSFPDAELHQGTTWRGTQWPGDPSPADADDHIDAYRQLRLRMNEIQDHDAELDFFAPELAAKRAKAGWSFAGVVILFYQALSDCGRSVGRPIAWFGALIGVFGPVFHGPLVGSAKAESLWSFYGFAAASLTGVLGTRREFFSDLTPTLPGWMQAVSGGLSLVGAVLVFLMALAVRNRFRIR
jgi:hypothetical protein